MFDFYVRNIRLAHSHLLSSGIIMVLLALAAAVLSVHGGSVFDLSLDDGTLFESFINAYNRQYESDDEWEFRYGVFKV